ncbi:MAG: large conductance mechanosensitive channel protein MscL [Clostridiales bacterium]|nr:large conductance mechanosensitive channel protein MscL [Clostridiales bacterium]
MKIIKEFKAFISRGNVMDMAVGVIIGSAFTSIVNSLVKDILNPLLGLLTGGMDFSSLSVTIGNGKNPAVFAYGAFISAVINFLLVALALFFIVKAINRLHFRKKEEKPAAPKTKVCPFCKSEIDIEASRCPHCTSEIPEKAAE